MVLAALQFDDDAQAILVGFITKLGDAVDLLGTHEIGNALKQARFVDLIRQLGHDDRLPAAVVHFFDAGARAHR